MTLEHHRTDVGRRRRALCAAPLAVAVLLVASGCGGSDSGGKSSEDTKPKASESEKPKASKNPEEAKKQRALDAYASFWKEQVKAYEKGSTKGTKVEDFATGEALAQLESDVARMQAKEAKNEGAPKHDAKVTDMTPKQNGKLATATISDCLDLSSWKTVDRKSGKVLPRPTELPRRALATVKAEDWGKQGWMMLKVTPSATKC